MPFASSVVMPSQSGCSVYWSSEHSMELYSGAFIVPLVTLSNVSSSRTNVPDCGTLYSDTVVRL